MAVFSLWDFMIMNHVDALVVCSQTELKLNLHKRKYLPSSRFCAFQVFTYALVLRNIKIEPFCSSRSLDGAHYLLTSTTIMLDLAALWRSSFAYIRSRYIQVGRQMAFIDVYYHSVRFGR